jgi:hypothetical protein
VTHARGVRPSSRPQVGLLLVRCETIAGALWDYCSCPVGLLLVRCGTIAGALCDYCCHTSVLLLDLYKRLSV